MSKTHKKQEKRIIVHSMDMLHEKDGMEQYKNKIIEAAEILAKTYSAYLFLDKRNKYQFEYFFNFTVSMCMTLMGNSLKGAAANKPDIQKAVDEFMAALHTFMGIEIHNIFENVVGKVIGKNVLH